MRLIPLLALLLAAQARAQVVPIAGRVSAPVSGAGAGAVQMQAPSWEPSGVFLLAPSLIEARLGAPAITPLETALAAQSAKTPIAVAALKAPDSQAPVTPSVFSTPAQTSFTHAALTETIFPTASKNPLDKKGGKNGPGETGSAKSPIPDSQADDGRSLFDGAEKRPADSNEPTKAELEAAFGPPRKPLKAFLRNFGIASGLLAVNTVAYAAVPHDGTETGLLGRLSFDTGEFLTSLHHFSFSGLADSTFRAFTSMFMHATPGHIIGNMVALVLFAPWVQSVLGGRRTLVIYLTGGLLAAAAQAFSVGDSLLLGASAAIAALMGAVLTIWSKPKGDDLISLYRLSFQALAAMMLYGEVKNLIIQGTSTPNHVATLAHVIGAAVGILLGAWYALGRRRRRAQGLAEK